MEVGFEAADGGRGALEEKRAFHRSRSWVIVVSISDNRNKKRGQFCCPLFSALYAVRLDYRAVGAGADVVGAAGVTLGVITRGAFEVWPVVVPAVELLEAGVELLTAVWLLVPHGPKSISAPAINTAAIIAVMVPVPRPVLRSSRTVGLVVSLLSPARALRPG